MKTKKYLILALFTLFALFSFGQSNELHFKTLCNYSSFRGPGAYSETYSGTPVNKPKSPFVVNPYGTIGKIGYGVGLAFQRNTKSILFFGLNGSIERLTSQIYSSNGLIYDNRSIPGSGSNELDLSYLNVQPYIGLTAIDEAARIEFKIVSDIGLLVNSQEQFTFKSNEGTFKFDHDREYPEQDVRFGLGMAVYFKRFAFNMEYLLGVVNFNPVNDNTQVDLIIDNSVYSQVFRFGLGYVILKT